MRVTDKRTLQAIGDLVHAVGGDPETFDGQLIADMVQTCLKMIPGGHDTGQLKLVNSAFYGFPRRISSITHAVVILASSTAIGAGARRRSSARLARLRTIGTILRPVRSARQSRTMAG